jgi:hypothetical protein
MAFCLRKDADEGKSLDEEFPVFLTQIVYQGALATIEIGQGNPNDEIKETIGVFKWLLQHLYSRWRVAGKFDGKIFADWALTSITKVYICLFYNQEKQCWLLRLHDASNCQEGKNYNGGNV